MASSSKTLASSSPTLPSLPNDLIRKILHMLPAESLVRLRLTCKQLKALINEESFIYEHLDRSKVRFLRTDQTVQIVDPENRTRSDSPVPYGFQPNAIVSMIHCDGLMLCPWSHRESTISPYLALWNPLTRKINLVKRRPSSQWFVNYHYYGIGYVVNETRRDYKILTFASGHHEILLVEIYECNSKSWRTLDYVKVDWDIVDPSRKGVSVKGNMYWLAEKALSNKNYILGFDFSDETFKDICFIHLPSYNNYLSCYDGDKLSLLQQNQHIPSPIEVWVSSKLADGNVSFTQYFTVSSVCIPWLRLFWYEGLSHPAYYITKNEPSEPITIFAWYCGYSSLLLSKIDENGTVNHVLPRGRPYWDNYRGTSHCGYVYVPSLVSLP